MGYCTLGKVLGRYDVHSNHYHKYLILHALYKGMSN